MFKRTFSYYTRFLLNMNVNNIPHSDNSEIFPWTESVRPRLFSCLDMPKYCLFLIPKYWIHNKMDQLISMKTILI